MPTPREKPALELAINLLRQMINDPDQRYWGTTYTDAVFPIVEAFDIETDCTWVIFCYALPKADVEMDNLRQRLIRYVSDGYRNGDYLTGVIPALYGADCQVVEVAWKPNAAMRREHDRAYEQRTRRMEQRLLRKIDAVLNSKGDDHAS